MKNSPRRNCVFAAGICVLSAVKSIKEKGRLSKKVCIRAENIGYIILQIKQANTQEQKDAKREIIIGSSNFLFFTLAKYTAAI